MIKVTAIIRDPNNPDNAILTIEYDVNDETQTPIQMDYPMENIVSDTLQEIKQNIIDFVAVERGDALWVEAQAKVTPYIGVDLEA